jgi:hypothetical protein
METIRKLADLGPDDLSSVERLFGQRIESTSGLVLILKTEDRPTLEGSPLPQGQLPEWCNVLEGMSDEDLADLDAIINQPVYLARSHKNGA